MFIKIPAMTFIIKPVTASPNDHPSENDKVDNVVPYNMAPTIPNIPENKWYTTLQLSLHNVYDRQLETTGYGSP